MSAEVDLGPQGHIPWGHNEAQFTAAVVKKVLRFPSHVRQLRQFLTDFTQHITSDEVIHPYMLQLQRIAHRKSTVLKVHLDDVKAYFQCRTGEYPEEDSSGQYNGRSKLSDKMRALSAEEMQNNAIRYKQLLYGASETIIKDVALHSENVTQEASETTVRCPRDKQRVMEEACVPIHLRAPYEIFIVPLSDMDSLSVRDVRAFHIGRLVKMDGVITKITSVKPRLQVAYYKCMDCGSNVYQPIDSHTFMPLLHCESQSCSLNQKKGELRMILPESIFVRYQELRIQELPHMVPSGSVPRTQKVIVEGSLTRMVIPGQHVTLSGILTPVMKTMYHQIRYAGLSTEAIFHVEDIIISKQNGEFQKAKLLLDSKQSIEDLFHRYQQDPHLYERLALSIAPSIHGLLDVKKILLLQLIGGVTEEFSDGMRLRGDIHVLLIGDPGVAKSQLLGQVAHIAPRAHYTTGKGSSGVGLTASVVRDPTTGDFTLEGGAIVLSDRGICCIDEFDKMDEYDRTAIHEVMEQQTVSISKAGLTTTLNARTSILAAANPQYGRYDITKSPMQNINLPAALLSRFDVQFLLLDCADHDHDLRLARHVLKVHQASAEDKPLQWDLDVLDADTIRAIVGRARTYNPKVPRSLMTEIVEYYVELRQRERAERVRHEFNSYTTPRTLFAVLRLSQSLARLRFCNLVDRGDFEEALRLVMESKRSVSQVENRQRKHTSRDDYKSDIIAILKDMDIKFAKQTDWDGWLPFIDVEEMVTRQGFSGAQFMDTLEAYVELNILVHKDDTNTYFGFSERVADYL